MSVCCTNNDKFNKSSAEDGAHVNTLVRSKVIEDVGLEDVGHGRNGALRVGRIIITRARNSIIVAQNVHFTVRVLEPEASPGNNGNGVDLVVNVLEVRYLIIR